MNRTSRREFIQRLQQVALASSIGHGLGGGLTALTLGAQRAFAEELTDPRARFLLIRIHGAMDSTLGLFPHLESTSKLDPHDLFLGYDAQTQPLVHILSSSLSLGPAASPVAPFAAQMSVVGGLYMGPNDLGHPFAMQHISSGRTQESAPSWAAYLGQGNVDDGKLVVTNAPLNIGQLKKIRMVPTAVLRNQMPRAAQSANASILRAYEGNDQLGVNQYLKLLKDKDKLARFVEISSASSNQSDEEMVVAAFGSDLARVAQFDILADDGGNLDTHVGHALNHLPNQKKRWERVAYILSRLQSLDLLRDTLVVVVTEFNRTPGLNANGGKDHNYTDNAVAFFGRGVNGGQVVGHRHLFTRADGFANAYWAGGHIDFSTGAPVARAGGPNVDLIRPADVWATVIQSLCPALKSDLPKEASVIPGLFQTG